MSKKIIFKRYGEVPRSVVVANGSDDFEILEMKDSNYCRFRTLAVNSTQFNTALNYSATRAGGGYAGIVVTLTNVVDQSTFPRVRFRIYRKDISKFTFLLAYIGTKKGDETTFVFWIPQSGGELFRFDVEDIDLVGNIQVSGNWLLPDELNIENAPLGWA